MSSIYWKMGEKRTFQSSAKPDPFTIMLNFRGDMQEYCAYRKTIDFLF